MPVTAKGGGARRSGSGAAMGAGFSLVIILCAISLVLFTLSCREMGSGPISSVRGAFTVATTPVRYLGAVVTSPFRGLSNMVSNLTADSKTLSELREENERLAARNAELEEAQVTAKRLEELLGLQTTYDLQSTAARIISGATDSWTATVTIDKGSAAGLAVGMPVTDSSGVIGQISECGATSSVVRLITDENSSVSAMVQSSRAQGMLKGSADGSLSLTLVRTDQAVEAGDLVITSGLGGVYPKGLPLGTVTNVEKPSGSLYYVVTVRAFTMPENYEEVLVITSLTDSQRATAEDVRAADEQETLVVQDDAAAEGADDAKDETASGQAETGEGETTDAG